MKDPVMATSYHHAVSSARTWGGTPDDYLAIHTFIDSSKAHCCDFRHRALLHHAAGIFIVEQVFGATLTLSTGKIIPTRWVAEQHVREDFGRIPTFVDWVEAIAPRPWMGKAKPLGLEDVPLVSVARRASTPG